jgi:aminopeptidase
MTIQGAIMTDSRIAKLAAVLIHYSLEIQPGQQLAIQFDPLGEELMLVAYEEAIKAGAHVFVRARYPETEEIFLKYSSEEQLDFVSPVRKMLIETFDALLGIGAQENTRALSNIDPARQARVAKASAPISKIFMERSASKALRWCGTEFPTNASAQEAEMSLREYQDFVYTAGKLNEGDPVAAWRAEGKRQQMLKEWLEKRSQVQLKGPDIDLKMSIEGRKFQLADGKYNFPDGEIFTAPVEDSVNGWVRFKYPAIEGGREVNDVELWFEDGKVIKEQASKNQDYLTAMLNTDEGARYLGEWGIGTNYDIPKFTKNMLFDEKLGGTIHLAVGAGYPETGAKNESGVHWDMLCDMNEGEITVEGDLFYKDGKPLVWE